MPNIGAQSQGKNYKLAKRDNSAHTQTVTQYTLLYIVFWFFFVFLYHSVMNKSCSKQLPSTHESWQWLVGLKMKVWVEGQKSGLAMMVKRSV